MTVLAAVLLLVGCVPTVTPDQIAASPSPAVVECLDVTPVVLARLQQGGEEGLLFTRAVAVRSPDFVRMYFVAAAFTVPGVEDARGVWVTNSVSDDEPAGFWAVSAVAEEFTDWGSAGSTDAAITVSDPSVSAAIDCLG